MYEAIGITLFRSIIIGLFCGAIFGIHKMLYLGLWLLALISLVIRLFVNGAPEMVTSINWGFWNWIVMLLGVNIAFIIGKNTVEVLKK